MKFPFSFVGPDKQTYYASKDSVGGIKVSWINGYGDTNYTDSYTEKHCEELVTHGVWRVTSVGEQKPAEAPTSPSKDISELIIKINLEPVTEATEAFKRLTEAVNATKVAMDNLKLSFD